LCRRLSVPATPSRLSQASRTCCNCTQPIANLGGFQLPTDNTPYRFSAAAIQPLDIKIQAALFAQEGCFFVIPGYWFNTDPQDTRANFERQRRAPCGRGVA
jgi:hypothetical protein